jgi:hypothetical protein
MCRATASGCRDGPLELCSCVFTTSIGHVMVLVAVTAAAAVAAVVAEQCEKA